MPDFHLTTSVHSLLIALSGVLAVALAVFAYRITLPPISRPLRVILTTLRGCGLFLLFLLIGEPLLSLIYHRLEKPVLAVLVDQSKSMTIQDRTGDRRVTLLKALDSPVFRELRAGSDLLYGVFDSKLHLLQSFTKDSITFSGDATDIGGALVQLKKLTSEKNLQSVLVLSDGNATTGASPVHEAEEVGLPVFTVGIGDTSEPHDVLVSKVLSNTITYVGNKVPVDVTIKSSGYDGEKVDVTILDGGKLLDHKTVTLEAGTREYDIPLSFVPDQEGMKKMTVELSQLPGEISYQNNRSSFYVKVLKSKMLVVMVAGAPSPDVGAIRRALLDDNNITVQSFIEKGNGQFYEGSLTEQVLQNADCILLVGYPGARSSSADLTRIANAGSLAKGMLFVLSRTTDFRKLQALGPYLPFVVPGQVGEETEAFISPREDQRNNPILKVSSSTDVWSKLPPTFILDVPFRAKPESELLATARIQLSATNYPMLLSRHVNRSKSIALVCYGIWRWKSYAEGIPGADRLLDNFFSNSTRWLVTRDDEKPVQVHPTREIFAGSDPVEFTGQAYDENYKPLDGAEISLAVTQRGQTSQLTLTALGNGRFEGSFDPLPEGDYTYVARATAGGQLISEERGSFSVGGLSAEFQETRANKLVLRQMADRSGGQYYDAQNLERLPGDIAALPNFRPRDVTVAQQFELWNKSWILAAVIAVFAMEWFLRKRNGML